MRNAHLLCTTCNKLGHLKDRCWQTFPELQRKTKLVQGVDDTPVPMDSICISAVDTCKICDYLPSWTVVNKKGSVQTTAATDKLPLVGGRKTNGNPLKLCKDKTIANPFGPLSYEDYSAEDYTYSPENYAGIIADVGAEGFASDKELYAGKARKQKEIQTPPAGQHASPLVLSPLVHTATKAVGQKLDEEKEAAGYKKDRRDEISKKAKSCAAPEHKADR